MKVNHHPDPIATQRQKQQYEISTNGEAFLLNEARQASFFLLGELHGQNAGFYGAGLGQEASNAGPLPQTPIPATQEGGGGEQKPEKVSLSLD